LELKEKILEIETKLINLTLKVEDNLDNEYLDKKDLESLLELIKSYSIIILMIKESLENNKNDNVTLDFINEKITDAEDFIEGALVFLK
jgi:sulfur relay (sulfurtransferase) DsrF/TusC family protein